MKTSRGKEVDKMSKKKLQKNSKQDLARILLATALIKLITQAIDLIKSLIK